MIAMTTALVMMMMAVVGGWCFLVGCVFWLVVFFGWGDAVGSRQRETALYFQLLPKTAGARIHWGAPRQCFSSLKERDDALDLQGSHAAAPILLLNNSN